MPSASAKQLSEIQAEAVHGGSLVPYRCITCLLECWHYGSLKGSPMHSQPQASFLSPTLRMALHVLLGITVLNYLAQIPYYIHFYGVHQVAPTPFAVLFLLVTFALFWQGISCCSRPSHQGAGSYSCFSC